MARETRVVTITAEGRDRNKQFRITEPPADQGERWANRVILAFANASTHMPEGMLEQGLAGLSASLPRLIAQGLRSLGGMRPETMEPLLEEMFTWVKFIPPGSGAGLPDQAIISGVNSQIEEISTRYQLRYETAQLVLGFLLAVLSRSSTPSPQAESASS